MNTRKYFYQPTERDKNSMLRSNDILGTVVRAVGGGGGGATPSTPMPIWPKVDE